MASIVTRARSKVAYALAPAVTTLPAEWVLNLYPTISDVTVPLGDVTYKASNLGPYEQFCAMAIAMVTNARRIFEFGTFDGATTLLLARACPEAYVWTLDLGEPVGMHDHENQLVGGGGVGARFAGRAEAERIRQLLGDSLTFDFAPHAGMDLVLVDACHEYEWVHHDTQAALRMLRPGGVILWDDYLPGWPGVTTVLHELAETRPVVQIASTQMAILRT